MSDRQLYYDRQGNKRMRRKRRSADPGKESGNLFLTPTDEARQHLADLKRLIEEPTPTT